MNKITFSWKPITEIPTEHWEKNDFISPPYLVKCKGTVENLPIIGYSNYSYATNSWVLCFRNTGLNICEVIAWSDVKL